MCPYFVMAMLLDRLSVQCACLLQNRMRLWLKRGSGMTHMDWNVCVLSGEGACAQVMVLSSQQATS